MNTRFDSILHLRSLKFSLWFALFGALALGACSPPTGEPASSDNVQSLTAAEPAAEPPAEPAETPASEPVALPEPELAPAPAPKPNPRPKPVAQPAAAAPSYTPPPQPQICYDCGTVTAITTVEQKGEGSGAGAVAGAVAGGVAGHQFGKGKGKDAATAAGVILGAIAGHQIEKSVKKTITYDITVAMEDGSTRVVNVADPNGLYSGARVRVQGENIYIR